MGITTTSLPLSEVFAVNVFVSPSGATPPQFNQAIVVGQSTIIPSSQRVQQFNSLAGIASAGFSTTSPEYLVAQIYFAQPTPPPYLWIGRQDLTAIQTVTVGATGSGGSGYNVGDILAVGGAGTGGQVQVATVNSGAVLTFSVVSGNQGTGYVVANNVTTTAVTGVGTGATVDITVIGETVVQAVTACRNATPEWYICYVVGAGVQTTGTATSGSTSLTVASGTGLAVGQFVIGPGIPTNTTLASGSGTSWTLSADTTAALTNETLYFYSHVADSDKEAVAAYIQGCTPPSQYFFNTASSNVLNNNSGNVFATCQSDNYTRTLGVYSTPQNGQFLSNEFFAAAPMGFAMGLATAASAGAASSYFTLMYKAFNSVATEPLTLNQVNTISGSPNRSSLGLSGNVYLNYANGSYAWMQNGTMFSSSGSVFFDQVLFLDMLASSIQYAGVNLLTSIPSLPITDAGSALLNNVISKACTTSQTVGFIAPSGVWNGLTIGPISAGTALPKGFFVWSPPVSTLTETQRANRQMPPISVLIILAQSGQSAVVNVTVQQ